MPNLVLGGGGAAASGYDIDQSLRFDDDSAAYLSKTFTGTPTLSTKATISLWWKRGGIGDTGVNGGEQTLISWNTGLGNRSFLRSEGATDQLQFNIINGSGTYGLNIAPVQRDVSAWYHIVGVIDTTQVTSTNRMKLYINGEQVTAFDSSSYPAQDETNIGFGEAEACNIGRDVKDSNTPIDGYLAEVHFIDGQALTQASFGKTDAATNQWKPIEVTGLTYGTNGFYQSYSSTELADSFTDSSSRTVTANGNVHTDTSVKKFGTASAQFDGTGDSLTMSDYSDWSFGTGDFTLETWVRFNDSAGNENLFNQYQGASNRWYLSADLTNNTLAFYDAGSGMDVEQTVGTFAADTWYHIAMVRTSGVVAYYMAGTRYTVTGTSPGGDITSNTGSLEIGEYNGGDALNGYLDEIRISDTARYSGATISVPTEAFTTDSNTLLLLHCDGSDSGTTFTDSSTRPRHTITAVGDVANTRAQYKVGDSSIKFDGTGDYLSTVSSGMGLTGDYTIECWFNTASSTSDNGIISNKYNNSSFNGNFSLRLNDGGNSNDIAFRPYNGTVAEGGLVTSGTGAWSDSTWTHVAVVKSGSGTGNVKMYIGGTLAGTSAGESSSTILGNAGDLNIGRQESASAGTNYLNGYMDEIRISDSARYTTDFNPVPTTAFTADANTMLLIHSEWNGGLGADSSGNKNDFAVTNLVATDQMIDTPTNNYCTFNPLLKEAASNSARAFTEGNLVCTAGNALVQIPGTFAVPTGAGKWYWEFAQSTSTVYHFVVGNNSSNFFDASANAQLGDSAIGFGSNGSKWIDGVESSYGTSWATDASTIIISVALNLDDDEITFYRAGVSQGAITISGNLLNADFVVPFTCGVWYGDSYTWVNFGADSSFAGRVTAQGNQDDNGKGDFYYDVPAGFLALCTDNLSDPAIALPTDHFNSILYTGNGGTQSLTGVGFAPDFFWNKNRTGTYQHMLYDTVRGVTKYLTSGETDAEATDVNSLTSFDSDGVTLGSAGSSNATDVTSVGWNWKAGGTPTTDNLVAAGGTPTAGSVKINGANLGSALAGTIAATRLSASTTAGFSIVSYTGTGSAATIGHGLAQAPDMVICKERSAVQQWINYQSPLGATKYLHLNGTDAAVTNSTVWNDEEPTPSVFSVGTAVNCNESSGTYIAYCFHSIEGYSKVGSYVGNGVVDGIFVYLGFKPAFLFWKQSSAARDWAIIDNSRSVYNDQAQSLFPNDSAAEYDGAAYGIDLVSNGFKWRSSNSTTNISSGTYIYYAVAESPFKTSNAR